MVAFVTSLTFVNVSPLARAAMVKPLPKVVPLYGNKVLNVTLSLLMSISWSFSTTGVFCWLTYTKLRVV